MRQLPRRRQQRRLLVVHDADAWVGLCREQQRQLQVGRRVDVHQPGGHTELKQLRSVDRRQYLLGAHDVYVVHLVWGRKRHQQLSVLLGDESGGGELV